MSKCVLLTGASGFIGRHTQKRLLELDYDVHAICRTHKHGWTLPGVQVHFCDLLNEQESTALVESVHPTHLLHLAWHPISAQIWTCSENSRWVEASLQLCKVFAECGGKRAVFAGTCAEYDWSQGRCIEGETPLQANTLYGKCKNELQSRLADYGLSHDLSIAWARLFYLYGNHEDKDRLVPAVAASLLKGNPIACTLGEQKRDYLHVQDAADAMVVLLDSKVIGPVNIASGQARAVAEIIRLIGQETGQAELIQWGAREQQSHEAEIIEAEIKRLANEVKFTPRFSLEEGIKHTIQWWREQLQTKP